MKASHTAFTRRLETYPVSGWAMVNLVGGTHAQGSAVVVSMRRQSGVLKRGESHIPQEDRPEQRLQTLHGP
ncbi:hypothetical protein HC928_23275 [bacterium]|nr:hypothetical protein [bacterium]